MYFFMTDYVICWGTTLFFTLFGFIPLQNRATTLTTEIDSNIDNSYKLLTLRSFY